MGENSKIAWTDHSLNYWVGCSGKVSPACNNCYAAAQSKRFGGDFTDLRLTSEQNRKKPLRWQKQAEKKNRRFRVFAGSMCDVFDPAADTEWREGLFDLIDKTPSLDWLLLTKRPQNITGDILFPDNVMIGITAEDESHLFSRQEGLSETLANNYFVSIEPMLGPVDPKYLYKFDWAIIGCEKIPGTNRPGRPMNEDWLREIVENRKGATFVKQMAIDGKVTDDPAKFPAWARRREFPKF